MRRMPTPVSILTVLLAFAPPAAAQGEMETFRITGADSVPIVAYWFSRTEENAPTALLLHDPGATYRDWGTLVTPLYRNGFQVMLIDFRGHGASRDLSPKVYEQLVRHSSAAYRGMLNDVEAAVSWLQTEAKVRPERIVLVGGQFAATLAMQAMARNPKLGAMVAISPSNTYFNTSFVEPAKKYGKRPLYILSPKQFLTSGVSDVKKIMSDNPKFELKLFGRSEINGVFLLNTSWNLEFLIVEWLVKQFADS